jgi:hypothetical protein
MEIFRKVFSTDNKIAHCSLLSGLTHGLKSAPAGFFSVPAGGFKVKPPEAVYA